MIKARPGRVYLDGTLGAGGYSEALLKASEPDGRVIALDLDHEAVEKARARFREYGARFMALHGGFHQAKRLMDQAGVIGLDGAALDLGLSSDQLDDPERGFSFMNPGPLDMRFDREKGEDVLELISRLSVKELEEIIITYSDERYFRQIAKALKRARKSGAINNTADLSNVISSAVKRREKRIHPATRTFQALRIAVNKEMENLEQALEDIPELLEPGARMLVVSYHSIEDRAVKISFRERAKSSDKWRILTKKPIRPEQEEIQVNPRARSAKLRVLEALK
jgi:16S rRNA (cytosine1402-N4)-methyltransferase